jgi:hypothetical protein
MNIRVTALPVDVLNRSAISRYNTLVMPPGNYGGLTDATKEKIKTWVQNGGVLIGFDNTLSWLTNVGLGKFDMKPSSTSADSQPKNLPARAYADIEEYRGAQNSPGAIFEASVDLTHPLLYGYSNSKMYFFKDNNLFLEKSKNQYANPITYGSNPLVSGYISKQNYDRLKGSSMLGISAVGRGRVIGFTENLNFRSFWLGTNKLFLNAVFYGNFINEASSR